MCSIADLFRGSLQDGRHFFQGNFFDRAQHERGPMQILDVLKFLAHLLRRVAPPARSG